MKFWIGSVLVHVLIICFVWVGFSVPSAKKQNPFTYIGGSVFQTEDSERLNSYDKTADLNTNDDHSSAFFEPWIKMRELNKPR